MASIIRKASSLICFLVGIYFTGLGGLYLISDIISLFTPDTVGGGYKGLGLGFMIGSGMTLFIGIPLTILSVFLFKHKNKSKEN